MNDMQKWIRVLMVVILAVAAGCASPGLPVDDADAVVAQAVGDRLAQEMLLDRASIKASSQDGVVTLHGVVRSEAQRARALAIARSTSGVREVVDRLRDY